MGFLETRVLAYGIMAPFIVPELIDEYAIEVEYRWGDFASTGVNLFKHWSNISLQKAILFQKYSHDHCVDYEDIVRCEWALELFVNSCNGAVIKSIEGK